MTKRVSVTELEVGTVFPDAVFPKWYRKVTKVIDKQADKALIEYETDEGSKGFAHMQFRNGEWDFFITSPYNDRGLLYGSHFDED